ncbi:unnamed protein product, partial [Rotaria magnacalcarata]
MNKKSNRQCCECNYQDSVTEGDDDNDDDDDDGIYIREENKRSKINLLCHKYILSYLTKFRELIT